MNLFEFIAFHLLYWLAGAVFIKKEKKSHFAARFAVCTGFCVALTVAFSILYPYIGNHAGGYGGDILFVILGILMILYLKSCWEIYWSIAVYNAIWFRMVWWIIVEIWRFHRYFFEKESYRFLDIFGIIVFFAAGYLLCERTIMRWIPEAGRKAIGPRQLLSAMLLGAIFELLAYMPEIYDFSNGIDRWFIVFLLQLICIFILYLQNELFRKSAMRQELELINLLLKKEKEQYLLSKENIAIINQKCHDLKHQIRAIRKSDDVDKSQYLKEVEESIKIYESIVKTGNEVLDTILTEKSLYCKERGIVVSCVTDGNLLRFIHVMDLYSLLGNAIDNAIEAVEKMEEPEMRQIDVMIYKQQNFVVIHIVNPIKETLVYEEELPVTTKEDKNLHGFGLRSMKYIVKKYNGYLSVSEEDGCFSLKMLIPMPEKWA